MVLQESVLFDCHRRQPKCFPHLVDLVFTLSTVVLKLDWRLRRFLTQSLDARHLLKFLQRNWLLNFLKNILILFLPRERLKLFLSLNDYLWLLHMHVLVYRIHSLEISRRWVFMILIYNQNDFRLDLRHLSLWVELTPRTFLITLVKVFRLFYFLRWLNVDTVRSSNLLDGCVFRKPSR